MVIDSIENAEHYYGLGSGIKTALQFFSKYNSAEHNETDKRLSKDVLIKRWTYITGPKPGALLEAHRKYIDVMFIADGEETLHYLISSAAEEWVKRYDPELDAGFANISPDVTKHKLSKNQFVILFPQDLHHAGTVWNRSLKVKKLIAKVCISSIMDEK